MKRIPYNNANQLFSTQNRNNQTLPERIVWYQLLNKSKLGFKFIRQYKIENYIIDFYCPVLKLGIELDGNTHQGIKADNDVIRDRNIKSYNIKLLRITNNNVLYNLDEVRQFVILEINKIIVEKKF
jgi:very-short-patch-repair endonuclease